MKPSSCVELAGNQAGARDYRRWMSSEFVIHPVGLAKLAATTKS